TSMPRLRTRDATTGSAGTIQRAPTAHARIPRAALSDEPAALLRDHAGCRETCECSTSMASFLFSSCLFKDSSSSTRYTPIGGQNLTFRLENGQTRCYREFSRVGADFAGAGASLARENGCEQKRQTSMTEFKNRPTTVADYFAIIRRRKWAVIVPPIVAGVAAFFVSSSQSPLYRAT